MVLIGGLGDNLMGNSLFDQLKASGLVDEKKAKKHKQSKYKGNKQKAKKGSAEKVDEAKLLAQQAQAEKLERDRLLNQQKKEEAEQKAIAAQVKQLIESNRISDTEGESIYNFTDVNVIKKLHLSEQVHEHLTKGLLAIAKLNGTYELVPMPVAEKIMQRDEDSIIVSDQRDDSETVDENDPYADYKIPDDLMW